MSNMRAAISCSCRVACLIVASLLNAAAGSGAEQPAWVNPELTVTDGLVLWVDASVQSAALALFGIGEYATDAPVEKWLDGSGYDRHLLQPDEKNRPKIRVDGRLAAMRFDGRSAHLSLKDAGLQFDELTIFIVAAPFSNEGIFRGLLSMHAEGESDFLSGINIDQGVSPSTSFSFLNVEGAGAGAMQNLRTQNNPFLQFRRLAVTSGVGPEGVELFVDGELEAKRARTDSVVRMDELIIGGRLYGAEEPRGFFDGEIAEIIIYDRVLSREELAVVDEYLAEKYAAVGPIPPPPPKQGGGTIARVAAPPPVQVLVPGFEVIELPVKLSNVNNVLYREDGVLVALGYDGNIHLLTDSDGDGIEDRDEIFWENKGQLRAPIGMALTPPGYKRGRGVVVAAKSKCLMLLDADGDDRAEEEVIVADGWQELKHGVDALGIAFDPQDHAIYFGLGVENFTDAYLLGDGTETKYRLDSERGAILRVSPDLKSREIFATGIRFPVGIRFNGAGDLFCTDQEGATWLANGNPFDELLHVQRGRHYGFPPRHPRHLSNVIDEPSVYDYRPQHQSTCGLNFNEPAVDGSTFGPDWWRSDAMVTGYSRGKLYRTKLAATEAGYVAQNSLLASVAALPADACIALGGSLVIAAHSGGPDWGSGPSGEGQLFKVTHSELDAPIPSLVWADSPREVRIAFDRPVDPKTLKDLASRTAIEGGEFVAAGDRLEILLPGYAAVEYQQNAPRFGVDVQGLQLTADRRTLIITTSPHFAAVSYAIALRGLEPSKTPATNDRQVAQLPDIDLQYDLSGVEAEWTSQAGVAWKGWLPHLDLDVSRSFTKASAMHDQMWQQLGESGSLTLRTSLDLHNMLRPDVQIGSTIDYQWPQEKVTLTFKSNCRFEVTLDGKTSQATRASNDHWTVDHQVAVSNDDNHSLEVRLEQESSDVSPTLSICFHTQEDPRPRALPIRRFVLPWAQTTNDMPVVVDNRNLPELAGGNWLRGHKEFLGSEAGCSKCHQVRGEGHSIGPDLTNLTKRDYTSVLRDITHPSFAINPDHVTQLVATSDGRVLSGTVRTEEDRLIVSDQEGKETIVPRQDVEEIQASELSIMPEGIPKALGPERLRDLLTFLLVDPPSMPMYGDLSPPPQRTLNEVQAVLAGSQAVASKRPLHIVLASGPKDHGLGEHDYPAWQAAWRSLFEMEENVKVTTADPWPSEEDLKSADVLVFYQQGSWTPERARDIDRFLRRGGGVVYIHFAVDGGGDPTGFAERIGLAWQGQKSKFRHGPLDVEFAPGSKHPIARNFDRVHFHDESYWNLVGDYDRINLLAAGVEEEKPQPLFWTFQPEVGGRVFVSIPGHFAWTFDDPMFRILLLRGIAWAAGEPVDRFNDLVMPGARVKVAAP
ncbi:MAG: hypothetical protein C0485_00265 [Pirellula sp.]|nr:hypothetical protein [Pirellula sp.]